MSPRTKRTTPKRWTHVCTELAARPDGSIRLAVISDTHGKAHENAARLVADREPDAILHAGDVGDPSVLEPFAAIAPLVVVRGNIDARADELPDSVDVQVRAHDGDRLATLLLQHICVAGPKLRADAAERARKVGADLVVCGHSHVPFIGRDRGFIVFNPGSIGPRRFALPIVFGWIELSPGTANIHHISCETGARWAPAPGPSAASKRVS